MEPKVGPTETTFELASGSKPITALAILLLEQAGKLDLADDVRKYVPELPAYDEKRPIRLVDLLQFCDVLSLYLCCGARAHVEFPQRFGDQSISLQRQGEMCVMKPRIFGDGASLAVRARRYPGGDAVSVPVLLD